ncbi:MAG: hypothetical protein A2583_15500 [Bdellovibrionales bacterium RIFOXYD1_FULL_53_11]|nr:MAG: hypothetical protein A2583_15500 [Bdellovibrionales bacterium RIFOXYD1_FULL_53_11]
MNTIKGMIFNIQKGSLEDGKGFRTVVFFKGCNLECLWCHNPESQSPAPQISYNRDLCKSCFGCREVCTCEAIEIKNGGVLIDRSKCQACGLCADNCQNKALVTMGRLAGIAEIVEIAERDKKYFEATGGGITLSGGEATLQTEFFNALVRELHGRKIRVNLETNGNFDSKKLATSLKLLDCIYLDIKAVDRDTHFRITGGYNDAILTNLDRLKEFSRNLIIRYLVVPGYNDSSGDLHLLLELLEKNRILKLELLKFHKLWIDKPAAIGRTANSGIAAIADGTTDHAYASTVDFFRENKKAELTLIEHEQDPRH